VISDQYVWLIWSSAFLIPWILLWTAFPTQRRAMWWASVFSAPFGLTEPLFVPEYWNPPSLFDLAQKTGFDIESLVFCFGLGGVGSVLYNALTGSRLVRMAESERRLPTHRRHYLALATPFAIFVALWVLPWNPMFSGIVAMAAGAAIVLICRPDLKRKTWACGLLFLAYYVVFLQGLRFTAPGYIERVWNLSALTGVMVAGMPIEELLFAVGFGMYWSGVYEHFTWRRFAVAEPSRPSARHAKEPTI
jgi:hypothetical protein